MPDTRVPEILAGSSDGFLHVPRMFTGNGHGDAFSLSGPWVRRDARISGANGRVVFERRAVLVPESWSQRALDVTASKYLRTRPDGSEEDSVWQMIDRVTRRIAAWAAEDGYVSDPAPLRDELAALMATQRACFNSPVLFNVGLLERPPVSACFINSVSDSMESILDLVRTEGLIFKGGSGSGVNLSALRGRDEPLSRGGTASGPVSFMRGYDAFAGAIKSGGATRRAACVRILDADHPDVLEFVTCKAREEGKARALRTAGYGDGLDGEVLASLSFQNANHALRVTDAFVAAVRVDGPWDLVPRTGAAVRRVRAREIWDALVSAAHAVGDPGLQFHDETNRWNTCPADGEIRSSNPCNEFTFLSDTACNLASLNLRGFQLSDGTLDVSRFVHAAEVVLLAQEVLVDRASYPTERIAGNSRRFRPLGLGFTNLGAYLMVAGIPYDSDAGRTVAAGISALMTGVAYRTSARVARARGPFEAWSRNASAFSTVISRHRAAVDGVTGGGLLALEPAVWDVLQPVWAEVGDAALGAGFRNAQVTLLAPTGTISLLMDADTTGVEPDLALVKRKSLVGGGELQMENRSVIPALTRLGYDAVEIELTLRHLRERGTPEGSEVLLPEDLPVFDCAFPATPGGRCVSPEGHLRMVAAVQPLLSGAVSKTVNLPADATVEDVSRTFLRAHELGLKSVIVYRDGCRGEQPLRAERRTPPVSPAARVGREKLPRERRSVTRKFDLAGFEGYVTAGTHADGRLGELFCLMSKEGSTVSGLLDAWATAVSIALQYGVPLDVLTSKFRDLRFEPAGVSDLGLVSSPIDYVVRWLQLRFPGGVLREDAEVTPESPARGNAGTGPPCANCGGITEPSGSCHRCPVCGTTTGCS